MEPRTFKPKYATFVWALVVLYAAPWLFSLPNAFLGRSGLDWKLFWLLSGTVWAIAGLLHLKGVFLKKITFTREIEIEMILQKPVSQSSTGTVRIYGDTVVFKEQIVLVQYLANAKELMQILTERSNKGKLTLAYEEHGLNDVGWSVEKNLFFLIGFAVYIVVMFALHMRPMHIVGFATDTLLFGWALLLSVLLIMKLAKWVKERMRRTETPKWI